MAAFFKECDGCGHHGKLVEKVSRDFLGYDRTSTGLPKGWTENVLLEKKLTFCGRCTAEIKEAVTAALFRLGTALMVIPKKIDRKITIEVAEDGEENNDGY